MTSPIHGPPRDWTGAMAAEAMNVEGPLSRDQISLQDAWEAIYDAWESDDAGTDRRCRHCGCMDHRACLTPDGPCAWVAQDICSHPDCVRAANATLWPHRGWLAGLADRLVGGPARARTWTIVALDGQAFALAAADVCDDADSWTGPDHPDDGLVILRRGLTMDRAWWIAGRMRRRWRDRPSPLFNDLTSGANP